MIATVSGACSVEVTQVPTTNDNCSGVVTGTTNDPLTYEDQGTYYINWLFTDESGNSSTATQTVIVKDEVKPDIPVMATVSGVCSVELTETPTTNDNCSGTVTGTTSDPLTYTELGTYYVSWLFTDEIGNSITVTQTVIVRDEVKPDLPVIATVSGVCSVEITQIPTTNDNCSGTVTGTTSDPLTYTEQGTYYINWLFTDENENSITATQTVIVSDLVAPIVENKTALEDPDKEYYCNYQVVTPPTAIDNCSGVVTGTTEDPTSFDQVGNYRINWKFTDSNSNVATATQFVEIYDNVAPVPPILNTVTDTCQVTLETPVALDECGGEIEGTTLQSSFSLTGTYTIQWRFNDGNGNSSVATQTVVILQNEAPIVPELDVIRVSCGFTATPPVAEDLCDGPIYGTTSDLTTFVEEGAYGIYWIFTDTDGNTSSVTQTIIIDDNLPPILTNLTPITAQCGVQIPLARTNNTCNGTSITGVTSDSLVYNSFGSYTIEWKFANGDGTFSTALQEVTIEDTLPPSIGALSFIQGNCQVEVPIPTANDNCSGIVQGQTTAPLTYDRKGIYKIPWEFTDASGNSVSVIQTVVVDDFDAPEIPELKDIVISCISKLPIPTTPDECAGDVKGVTVLPNNFAKNGVYVLNWTFNDGNGNEVSAKQNVTVSDSEPPAVDSLEPIFVECGTNIEKPTLIDDCSGLGITAQTSDPIRFDKSGNYQINWVFTDVNGNSSEAVQQVEVSNMEPPQVPSLPIISDSCQVIVTAPITQDLCSDTPIVGTTNAPLIYDEVGTYEIEWTFTSSNGLQSSGVQFVQVEHIDEITEVETACQSFEWRNGITYSSSISDIEFTQLDADGCEVLYILDLTVNEVDTGITRDENQLMSNQSNATYQWLDCNNGNLPIIGETDQFFIPETNGSYAVELTYDGCTEISECISFLINDARSELDENAIFPNPTEGKLNVNIDESHQNVILTLLTLDNKVILTKEVDSREDLFIEVNLPPGTYMLRISSSKGVYNRMIIKK